MEEIQITTESLAPLKDRVVVVTGGASGIGLATVQLLLSIGSKVVSVDWSETSGQVDADPEHYEYVRADVSSWASLRAAFDQAIKKYGHIDHVFANAGMFIISVHICSVCSILT